VIPTDTAVEADADAEAEGEGGDGDSMDTDGEVNEEEGDDEDEDGDEDEDEDEDESVGTSPWPRRTTPSRRFPSAVCYYTIPLHPPDKCVACFCLASAGASPGVDCSYCRPTASTLASYSVAR
jgi:hypothetical protein